MAMIAAASLAAHATGQNNQDPAPSSGHEISGLESFPDRLIPPWVRAFGGLPAFTEPSRDSTMGFSFSTEIREVLAKAGTRVKKGDLLVRARDDEAVASAKAAQFQADNDAEIRMWEATLRHAHSELKNLQDAYQKGGVTESELDAKETEVEVAERRLENAKAERELAGMQAKIRLSEVDRFQLRAPFDGEVARIDTDVGAIIRETEPVLRIVNIDSFRIRVNTPERDARRMGLEVGDPVWVVLDEPEALRVYEGKITEISPDVDFGAKVQPMWVEVPNVYRLPSGLSAWVRFSQPRGEWASRIVSPGEGEPVVADDAARGETDQVSMDDERRGAGVD